MCEMKSKYESHVIKNNNQNESKQQSFGHAPILPL